MKPLRDYQAEDVEKIFAEWKEVQSTLYVAATGCGKCLGRGTLVLMFDGTTKAVEDIVTGDMLIGPDSLPREVLSTTSGTDELFRVIPVKGDSYVVNSCHVLCLKMTNGCKSKGYQDGQVFDMSLDNYLAASETFRHEAKGWRSAVEFPWIDIPLPGYFIGLWLGDGSSNAVEVSKPDPEVLEYMKSLALIYDLRLTLRGKSCPTIGLAGTSWRNNAILNHLRDLNLLKNKHVPLVYKRNHRDVRIQVLAGLLDSDGSLIPGGGYDFISVNKTLALDTAWLARSIGLAAYVSPCVKGCQNGFKGNYWRVSISGDCSELPIKIPRKKAPVRRQKKNVLSHGIKVVPEGRGAYYGFTLDRDGRFLLGDFTVTHNTRVMVAVAQRMLPGRTLLLAHRTELITQAQRAFLEQDMHVEIEKADSYAESNLFSKCPVVIATVQTLLSGGDEAERMKRFDPKQFSLLLYDECHHGISVGNKKIVDYFTKGNPDLRCLGVTATPDRTDEEALGQIFQTVASERDILWANENGWLVPPRQRMISVQGLDFSEMRTTCGDLNSSDLAAVMESEESVQGVVQPTLETMFDLEPGTLGDVPTNQWEKFLSEYPVNHRAIVFTISVKQAEMLSNIFNRACRDISCWVCGKTEDEERKQILKQFAKGGDHNILVNVGIATEGYDNPDVDTIVMARPTKSRSLYAQCIGRALRPEPGIVDANPTAEMRKVAIEKSRKGFATILDFVGNSGRHKLICTADLLGGNTSDAGIERAIRKVKESATPTLMTTALLEAEEELKLEAEQRRLSEEGRKSRLLAKVNYSTTSISPFDVFGITPGRDRGWDSGKTLSPKQREVLLKQGVDPTGMPYSAQKQVLNEVFRRFTENLCSFKQAKLLQRNGITQKNVTREQASKIIDALAKNQWKPIAPEFVAAFLKPK